jgi:chromosome segregation ATPase
VHLSQLVVNAKEFSQNPPLMSTSPSNGNDHSDFLQFESIRTPKSDAAPLGSSESVSTATFSSADLAQVDVDQEINSLLALMSAPSSIFSGSSSVSTTTDPKILQKITAAQQLLADIHQENQIKAAVIEQNIVQVQELRHRSEKLAKFNKLQVQQVQEGLKSFEQIRDEIVSVFHQVGGSEQIQPLLQQIIQAKDSLHLVQRQLQSHQTDVFRSLQQIQEQVENRSANSESFLQQHKSDLNNLLSSVQVDRQQLMAMQNTVAEQLQRSTELNNRLAEKSTLFQNSIADINNKFTSLSDSVQYEKQQFYQLTVETMDKADTSRSQFTEVTRQVGRNAETMKALKTEIKELRTAFEVDVKQEVSQLNSLYDEMLSTWNDTKRKQNNIDQHQRLFQNWLFSLTVAVAVMALGLLVQFLK